MQDPVATALVQVPHLNKLSEAAAKLRRSKAWLHARMAEGTIEAVRLSSRSVFITDDEILRYLSEHGLHGAQAASPTGLTGKPRAAAVAGRSGRASEKASRVGKSPFGASA